MGALQGIDASGPRTPPRVLAPTRPRPLGHAYPLTYAMKTADDCLEETHDCY